MKEQELFKENLKKTSQRIYDFLTKNEDANSWQVKTNLNLSSSVMYLAIGMLVSEGKIEISEEGINYKLNKPTPKPLVSTQPATPINATASAPENIKN